jgi:hypothetical protein
MAATIAMCSQDKARRERIEFPGRKSPGEHRLQCKHCLRRCSVRRSRFTILATPATPPALFIPARCQLAFSPLLRSQQARAPPQA